MSKVYATTGNSYDCWEVWERGHPEKIICKYTNEDIEHSLRKKGKSNKIPSSKEAKRIYLYEKGRVRALKKVEELNEK